MSPTSPRHQATAAPPSRVHRASHLIHKQPPSSSASSSSSNSSGSGSGSAHHRPPPRQHKHQQQQPVIIYTHSPKVIRTNPRDFMSIVQKLTGLETNKHGSTATSREDSSSSTDSCANQAHVAAPPPYVDPHPMPPPPPLGTRHFIPPEIPLFAPAAAASEMPLCASRGFYGGGPFMNSAGGATAFSPDLAFPDH
ncbi:VQ motif-containing protein 8, chloroplastic-like [Oryza brachyantha]|uniref:VQ domain-containing protein n=1 Tax=Oryza brachyantha TaxID=4533 RepID=J3N561_ORYBR|nr:VQ motif-containing protein 8, chloroplastic-like [Oryza brachyantha]